MLPFNRGRDSFPNLMSAFSQILMGCEALTYTVGLTSMAVNLPTWFQFRNRFNREVARHLDIADRENLSSRELKRAVDVYVDARKQGQYLNRIMSGFRKWTVNPIVSFQEARDNWKFLKGQIGHFIPAAVRLLIILEATYTIGTTALEIGVAFLYSRLGGNFVHAILITVPLGTAISVLRRFQIAVFAKRRIAILQRPKTSMPALSSQSLVCG